MRRRRHRVHVTAGIDFQVFAGRLETAALHDALAKAVTVGGSREIRDRTITEIAKPVVHPFHDVPGHVAQARTRYGRTYRMHGVSGVTGAPRITGIPVSLGRERPFRFRRQAESQGHGAEGEPFEIRTVLVVVYHDIGVGVSRIHAGSLALRVRIKHRVVVGHVGHGHRVASACHHKPRHILHDSIEFAAGHLAHAQHVIVRERHLHLGAFVALGGNLFCANINVLADGTHFFKASQAIGKRAERIGTRTG